MSMSADSTAPHPTNATNEGHVPDLGDLVIVLLAGTLAGLRDRLAADGFADAAQCVAATVDVADAYLETVVSDG